MTAPARDTKRAVGYLDSQRPYPAGQITLARAISISPPHVCHIERGWRTPNDTRRHACSAILHRADRAVRAVRAFRLTLRAKRLYGL
jgi:hypothetical protein